VDPLSTQYRRTLC